MTVPNFGAFRTMSDKPILSDINIERQARRIYREF
jgi:hypothetical protein